MTTKPDDERAEGVREMARVTTKAGVIVCRWCGDYADPQHHYGGDPREHRAGNAMTEISSLRAEVERLTAENAALRKQARDHEECIGELEYAQENAALRAAQPDVERDWDVLLSELYTIRLLFANGDYTDGLSNEIEKAIAQADELRRQLSGKGEA